MKFHSQFFQYKNRHIKGLKYFVIVACAVVSLFDQPGSLHQSVSFVSNVQAATKTVLVNDVVKGYADLVFISYQDAAEGAQQVHAAVETFLAQPSQSTLNQAKSAWLKAREVYGQTEVYRFYGGPIDTHNGLEGQINAWPIDESYVDYVQGAPRAGLIQRTDFEISKTNLIAINERGGEENVATGWHAIEFLLWGQDLNKTGPGTRPYTDYVLGTENLIVVQRRRLYLSIVSQLLVDDLESLVAAWVPGSSANYRSQFEAGGLESLRHIVVGMSSLSRGELAGERMEVALSSQDQEDEQSCFSDHTHRDIVANAQAILNIWQGQYTRSNGEVIRVASLANLVASKNQAVADRTGQQIVRSVELAHQIQAPFDQELGGGQDGQGKVRIQATINSLIQQSEFIVSAASALGISKLTVLQP